MIARLALALLVLPGCVTFVWQRETVDRPVPELELHALAEGQATLAECLERLGAPLRVWEYKGDGTALAWGWRESDSKRISVSVPLQDNASASMSWEDEDANLEGVVLLFDDSGRLELVRKGLLRDLREQVRRARPAPVEPGS